jgi:hypothetical protein
MIIQDNKAIEALFAKLAALPSAIKEATEVQLLQPKAHIINVSQAKALSFQNGGKQVFATRIDAIKDRLSEAVLQPMKSLYE